MLVFLISDIALVFWYTEPYMKEMTIYMIVETSDIIRKHSEIQQAEMFVSIIYLNLIQLVSLLPLVILVTIY